MNAEEKRTFQRNLFLSFLVVIFVASLMIVMSKWKANSYYTEAYRPHVQEYQQNRQAEAVYDKWQEEKTYRGEPQAPGFAERDIDKVEGDRFKAF